MLLSDSKAITISYGSSGNQIINHSFFYSQSLDSFIYMCHSRASRYEPMLHMKPAHSELNEEVRCRINHKLDIDHLPQAEQSGSPIFERKLVDLEEWETTVTVILLLLICLMTLTQRVSWNEPCNINTQGGKGKQGPTKKDRSSRTAEMTLKRVPVLRKPRWERPFKWSCYIPLWFFRMTKSARLEHQLV